MQPFQETASPPEGRWTLLQCLSIPPRRTRGCSSSPTRLGAAGARKARRRGSTEASPSLRRPTWLDLDLKGTLVWRRRLRRGQVHPAAINAEDPPPTPILSPRPPPSHLSSHPALTSTSPTSFLPRLLRFTIWLPQARRLPSLARLRRPSLDRPWEADRSRAGVSSAS